MATPVIDDLQAEAPPSKRVRFDKPVEKAETPMDDMDGIHSTTANTPTESVLTSSHIEQSEPIINKQPYYLPSEIPGLGLLGPSAPETTEGQKYDILPTKVSNAVAETQFWKIPDPPKQADPEDPESPSVTLALEAMLDKLDPQSTAALTPPVATDPKDGPLSQPKAVTVPPSVTDMKLENLRQLAGGDATQSVASEPSSVDAAMEVVELYHLPNTEALQLGLNMEVDGTHRPITAEASATLSDVKGGEQKYIEAPSFAIEKVDQPKTTEALPIATDLHFKEFQQSAAAELFHTGAGSSIERLGQPKNAEVPVIASDLNVMESRELIKVEAPSAESHTAAPNTLQATKFEEPTDTLSISGLLGGDIPSPSGLDVESMLPPAEAITHSVETLTRGDMMDVDTTTVDPNEAEFEVDSSPIESSSDDSSDDSSSSEDSDGEDAYKLLDPEEQARILMEGDGGSDDEGAGAKGKGSGGQLRTKNEVPEEAIPKPNVIIRPEMRIEELGAVEAVVESILLIKANISGEYRVLESGSVLCLADRSVIGVVSETLGRVQQPLYSVRFTNSEEIADARLAIGTKVYCSEEHSIYVFTQALKAYKGSDASNLHDEEVGDEEIEFSDDDAEAEHKRRIKQKKEERRGKRGGYPPQQQHDAYNPSVGLKYDDDDEGPYKPLSRPVGFANVIGRREAPQEVAGHAVRDHRGNRDDNSPPHGRGRGRDRGRGRGDRGRGNDRGRGRGGFQDRRNDGHAQPAYIPPVSPSFVNSNYNYNQMAPEAYNPQQPHYAASYAQPPYYQQPTYTAQSQYPQQPAFPTGQPQVGWPNMAPGPPMAAGAYINPAFFGNTQQVPGPQWAPAPQPQRNPETERAFQEAQDRLNILRNLSGSRDYGQ